MAYAGYATPALTHSLSSRSGYPTPRTPGPGYDDYGRYPYGDPVYDDAGYGDVSHNLHILFKGFTNTSEAIPFIGLLILRTYTDGEPLRKQ